MLDEAFGRKFLQTINAMHENPVHLLFNQWWNEAPKEVVAGYRDLLMGDPAFAAWVDEGYYAEPLDLDALDDLPEGTLGKTYRDWIVDQNLTAQIAMNYRDFHKMLSDSGSLDGMPEEMQYAVLRGFQLHDFMHVLSGYDPSPGGEIALQAFSLAEINFPYFAMWMSVSITRATFGGPQSIPGLMDAITDGWQYGRRTPKLSFHNWEDEVERPLSDIREQWGIAPTPFVDQLWERRAAAAS